MEATRVTENTTMPVIETRIAITMEGREPEVMEGRYEGIILFGAEDDGANINVVGALSPVTLACGLMGVYENSSAEMATDAVMMFLCKLPDEVVQEILEKVMMRSMIESMFGMRSDADQNSDPDTEEGI